MTKEQKPTTEATSSGDQNTLDQSVQGPNTETQVNQSSNKPADGDKAPDKKEQKAAGKTKVKKGSRVKNHLQTTWRHIRRSPYQALAAVLTLTVSFWVATMFVMTAAGAQSVIEFFESKPQVTAFFTQEPQDAELQILTDKIKAVADVANINFISQEQALEIYREMNKDEPLLLEMVTANILPSSLEVSTTTPGELENVAQVLNQEANIEEVVFQQDVVETLSKWAKNLRTGGLVLVVSLAVVSFLVILVVIGMKISMHRGEIEIMKLIGATKIYIRWPFVLEGMIYGFLGGLLSWLLALVVLLYSTPFLIEFLKGLPIFPVSNQFLLYLLLGNIGVGLFWGTLASWGATQRFLARERW